MNRIIFISLFINSIFASVIIPEVRRDQSLQNDSVLGATWSKRKNNVGLRNVKKKDADKSTKIVNAAIYDTKLKVELDLRSESNDTNNGIAKLGYVLEDSVVGIDYYKNDSGVGTRTTDLAYGRKHSGNIYSGFAIRNISFGSAESNQIYGGLGYLNEFDENRKTAFEVYFRMTPGELKNNTEIREARELWVKWTEIQDSNQYTLGAMYRLGDSERNNYDYNVRYIYGDIEQRATENLFVSIGYTFNGEEKKYQSGTKVREEENSFNIKIRAILFEKHQVSGQYIYSDEDSSSYVASYFFIW